MGVMLNYKDDPFSIITILSNNSNYISDYSFAWNKYNLIINNFFSIAMQSSSSADLLATIRDRNLHKDVRMSYLKLFRRCVCSSLDTELSKKIQKVSTEELVQNFGDYFINISFLKQFITTQLDDCHTLALSCLLAEYDKRGESGYQLTNNFFNEIEELYPNFQILGPRGAGSDIELNTLYPNFTGGSFPCDFVIIDEKGSIRTVGFCRYDSTRGGAQSDDRTGGNSQKVSQVINHFNQTQEIIKILFVSDGPGLAHNDTWQETLSLDSLWYDNIRVTTLKTVKEATDNWL